MVFSPLTRHPHRTGARGRWESPLRGTSPRRQEKAPPRPTQKKKTKKVALHLGPPVGTERVARSRLITVVSVERKKEKKEKKRKKADVINGGQRDRSKLPSLNHRELRLRLRLRDPPPPRAQTHPPTQPNPIERRGRGGGGRKGMGGGGGE